MYNELCKPYRPNSIKFPEIKHYPNHGNSFKSFTVNTATILQNTGGNDSVYDQGDTVVYAEKAETASSALIGLEVIRMSFWLKVFDGTLSSGNMEAGFFNAVSAKTRSVDYGDLARTSLTGSYVKYDFDAGTHTIVEDDRFGVRDEVSDGTNRASMDGVFSDVYDSTDSVQDRFIEAPAGFDDWSPASTRDIRFEIEYNV